MNQKAYGEGYDAGASQRLGREANPYIGADGRAIPGCGRDAADWYAGFDEGRYGAGDGLAS